MPETQISFEWIEIEILFILQYRVNEVVTSLIADGMNYKIVFTTLFVLALLLPGIYQATAQVEVSRGSTHKYSVTPVGNTPLYYHWSVTPGGTSSPFGTGATSNDIIWDGAIGDYVISVYPTKQVSDCDGNSNSLSIRVVEMNIKWTITSSVQCPKTDNQTGDFIVTVNYTGVQGGWSFKYSIDNAPPQTVNVAIGNSIDILVPGFTNASSSVTELHTIRIASVSTADNYQVDFSGAESDAASHIHSVTVEPTPDTSGILQL